MKEEIEAIKDKLDIVDYVGSYVNLTRAGRNFKGRCPFHQEKTPSFMVSPDRQRWHCFGACHEGGDIISFVMKMENISFYEALQDLAHKVGILLKSDTITDQEFQTKKRLYHVNELASQFYIYYLYKKESAGDARSYLKHRKFNIPILKTFEVGYAPHGNSLLAYLRAKKVSVDDAVAVGLLGRSERGEVYDRFRDRIMFPIRDHRNNIVGFSGRLLEEKPNQGKYVNVPETVLYRKRETLYGINLAKSAIQESHAAIIVEGEFDVISSHMYGITNTVGIKGSAFTKEQLLLLKRYCQRLVLALDTDESGFDATKRTLSDIEELEFKVEVALFDHAKDPDEALQKDPILYKKRVSKPVPIYDYVIQHGLSQVTSDPYSKKLVAESILPILGSIKNPILFEHYKKKMADGMSVSMQALDQTSIQLAQKEKKKLRPSHAPIAEKSHSREDSLQQFLLSYLLHQPSPRVVYAIYRDNLPVTTFAENAYQDIARTLYTFLEAHTESGPIDVKTFMATLAAPLHEVFDQIYLSDTSSAGILSDNEIRKQALELRRIVLRKTINELTRQSLTLTDTQVEELQNKKLELAKVEKDLTMM